MPFLLMVFLVLVCLPEPEIRQAVVDGLASGLRRGHLADCLADRAARFLGGPPLP